jgi:hypothetical protein
VEVFLPPAGWTRMGPAAEPRGWRFRSSDPASPVGRVTVAADEIVIRGGGAAWGYTLDEAAQGRVAVRLQLGNGQGWCADAPAKATGNPPSTARFDRAGRFTAASRTAAPTACPPPPAP